MKKTKKKAVPKNPPTIVEADPIPKFYRISQLVNSGKLIPLFPKPVFCTQERGLLLGLEKCTLEDDFITIQVKLLSPSDQKLMFLESGEFELTKYTKE